MKLGFHMAAALALTAAQGISSASAAPAPATGTDLALRRVLLSSGGVGYFEYEATLQGGTDLRLSVRRDQVDDVLKSLVVFDEAGNLGEVSLPGKELVSEAFRDLPFPEAALESPAALLGALRGAEVRVESKGSVLVGRIISVTEEQVKVDDDAVTRHRLSLLSGGTLHQVIVEEIESLTVQDEALRTQLAAALDALSQQRERERRELTIHLAGAGERVVRAGYVVEVPLWKSTYRLILPPSPGAGKAALTGFAVVENRTGEPWTDVALTLISGNPVTFRQAIYDTYYVDRPTVPVEVRGRVLPRRDEGGVALPINADYAAGAQAEEAMAPSFAGRGGFLSRAPKREVRPPGLAPITPAESTEQAAQVTFHLPSPVSLGSGETALLPVISLSLPAPRAALYQPETEARHPLSSIEITNDSPTDLPPGVLVIYERATGGELTYAGDAQLSLLPAGKSRFVSYAVDLRMTVDRAEKDLQTITLATIADGTLRLTRTERKTTTYTLAGARDERRTVIIEHPRIPGFELVASNDYQVMELTEARYRLRREVPAGATIKINVILERPLVEGMSLAAITAEQLGVYAASTDIPATVRAALQRIIALRADVTARETTLKQRTAERARILEDQTRLRENLKAVPVGTDLATRYLARLSAQEDRLSALEAEIAAAESAVNAAREVLAAEIRALRC